MTRVAVPTEVLKGIAAVHDSGLTNMLDTRKVARIAEEMGFAEAAEWVRAHRKEYAKCVFGGFCGQVDL